MPASLLLAALFYGSLLHCASTTGFSEEEARAALEPALLAATPAGRTGLLLKGKAVWLQAPMFDKACLEQNDLAFNDDPGRRPTGGGGIARISPTYKNQRYLTASTPTGYCVLLGEGLKAEVREARFDWGTQDRWHLKVAWTMSQPTPWFNCLDPKVREREIAVVRGADGSLSIEGGAALAAGDCPHPLPAGEERTPGTRPTAPAPKAPGRDDVLGLLQAFDEALWQGDFLGARELLSCYNLFEEQKVGTCSVGELVALGPLPRGEPRLQDGTPWLEYVQDGAGDFTKIVPDRKDRSLFHVLYKHKRTGKERSLLVQWAEGRWKLVGVVGRQAEALTTARIVNDLHDPRRRDIFERRLQGEAIDEEGNSLIPEHLREEPQK